jgi:uncharacterized protein
MLETRLLYGYYPEVVMNQGNEREILKALTDSFLYKDILQWDRIQKADKMLRLLQALAFQVGQLVSYNELSQLVGLDSKTVEKYINLLEQVFVIFRLNSYSSNPGNELKNSRKIYFHDNGIRNALIADFKPIGLRNDIGQLWENWAVSERLKFNGYNKRWVNTYFWRTKQQQEVDYLELYDGEQHAYEFKWNPKKKPTPPASFKTAYPDAQFQVITPDTMETFLLGEAK